MKTILVSLALSLLSSSALADKAKPKPIKKPNFGESFELKGRSANKPRDTETAADLRGSVQLLELLHLPPGTAVLMRSRVTFEITGRAFAYEQGLYRGVYRLEWSGHKLREMDTTGATTEPLAAP